MSAMRFPWIAFLCGCTLLAGCGNHKEAESPKPTPSTTTGGNTPATTDKVGITDIVVGKDKRVAEVGDSVWVLYKGTLKNGTVFDENMSPGKDVLTLTLGQGQVIKGWEDGIPGMHVGGERKLHIPSSLGYGPNGNEKIPANSDLDFDIKLVGLVKVGQENVIEVENVKPGSGRPVKEGDTVTIKYTGSLLNGKVFDQPKEPYTFTVGKGETLSCIEKGVQGMMVGGVRNITSPPLTAYASVATRLVPANSVVKFRIELVGIK